MSLSIGRVARLGMLLCAALAPNAGSAETLTLRRAIELTREHNPELQAFEFRLQAQQSRIAQAGQRPPLEASVDLENVGGNGDFRGASEAEATLSLSGVVELGGRREARVGTAEAEHALLTVEQQTMQLDLLAEVARRFLDVAVSRERRSLTLKARELAERTVAATERRIAAAKAPHAELDRARIALARAVLDERSAAATWDTTRQALAASWGQRSLAGQRVVIDDVAADPYALETPEDFQTLMARLESNPDLARFASERRLRDAEMRLASALRKPDLTLSAGVRRLQGSGDQALVLSFSLPLATVRRADPFIAEARANRTRTESEEAAAILAADTALFQLHRDLVQAVNVVASLRTDILPRAEEALAETTYAYERGRYSYLELVDAQREFFELESTLIDAAADAHRLRIEIERLTNAPLARPGT